MELRVADREAARVRDLVGSHNRLHELIARDAPIGDVLGELVEGIERYEPSVMPSVVLLDRESSTLHPMATCWELLHCMGRDRSFRFLNTPAPGAEALFVEPCGCR